MRDRITTPDEYRTRKEATRWDRVSQIRSYKYRSPVRGGGKEERKQSDVSAYSRARRKNRNKVGVSEVVCQELDGS